MKILAIDPGAKRIGLAACDALQLSTRLLPVLVTSALSERIHFLKTRISDEGYQKVLIGLPLNMDGSEGPAARRSRDLAQALGAALLRDNIPCEIQLWDERLTTFEAEQRLRQKGISKAKARDFLDSVAAEVLLEDYLRTNK
jgi:putative pre-16S rRNA nuclease